MTGGPGLPRPASFLRSGSVSPAGQPVPLPGHVVFFIALRRIAATHSMPMTSRIDPASGPVTAPASPSPFRNFGRTLRLLRELRGKGLKELAREVGVGASQLSGYENGRTYPKLDAIEKILGGLGLTPLDLFHTLALVDSTEKGLGGRSDLDSPFSLPAGTNLLGPSASRLLGQTLESLLAFQAEVVTMAVRGQLAR